MTATAILDDLQRRGATARILPTGKLRIEPAEVVDAALLANLKAARDDIIAELRRRDPLLVAAQLLHDRRWLAELPVCGFLIGRPGERCLRCGASWHEHYRF